MNRKRAALIGVSLLLLAICYARTLAGMVYQWTNDEDMGHGFAVPFVMLFIAWRERKRWQSLKPEPSAWGFAILAAGAAMQFLSALGTGLFAGSVAFLISLFGLVVCFGGFPYVRAWAFPLILGLFMLPKTGCRVQPSHAADAVAGQPHGGRNANSRRFRRDSRRQYSGRRRASGHGRRGVQRHSLPAASGLHGRIDRLLFGSPAVDARGHGGARDAACNRSQCAPRGRVGRGPHAR